jgi:hypothetical protein
VSEGPYEALEVVYVHAGGDIVADVEKVPGGIMGTLVQVEEGSFELQDQHRPDDAPGPEILPNLVFAKQTSQVYELGENARYRVGQVVNCVDCD